MRRDHPRAAAPIKVTILPVEDDREARRYRLANEEDPMEVSVPAFQTGGFVRETGIALVHEGEYILPAHGSEAVIEPAELGSQSVVNYYFPVEVVIVGRLPEEEHDAIQSRVWQRLTEELDRLG